jgi:peptide/nickel transport system ATP-binding protein
MSEDEIADLLTIKNLSVVYRHGDSWFEAVRDFSLHLNAGQTYGLVGESGSGKTTVALAIMRYLGDNGQVRSGTIDFLGHDLLSLPESSLRDIWGVQLTLVPQDPLSSLNPSIQIGEQLAELLRHHVGYGRDQAKEHALDLLAAVRVPNPSGVARSYPHQLSGGMQQRVMIAMALSTEPKLLVLDEPTTALDVTTQAAILDLFCDLIEQHGTAALYVTHNLGVVARICDRIAVLYAGELVEDLSTNELFRRPIHPYTQGLLESVPIAGANKKETRLRAIPGRIPALGQGPTACTFAPRCPLAIDLCHQVRPELDTIDDSRRVRCHRWPEIQSGKIGLQMPDSGRAGRPVESDRAPDSSVLQVEELSVNYELRRSLSEVLRRTPARQVKAVEGVSLTVPKGRTLGLVGESGSGKTSLARAVVGLEKIGAGSMRSLEVELPSGLSKRSRGMMRQLQIIFQNPEEALNPYMTVGETLRRPLVNLRKLSKEEAGQEVIRLLASVRLPVSYVHRRPDQLSGGEKQRVAIARAFAAEPDLLIADEPLSALDVSVQASILNLLGDLQEMHGIGTLFISHDLAVVGYLADEIAVIYAGTLMELSASEKLFTPPHHPYTEALISAIPKMDPDMVQDPIRLEGDVPSPIDKPGGCPFHPRCPRYRQMNDTLGDLCSTKRPPWQETQSGKRILCHIPPTKLKAVQESP